MKRRIFVSDIHMGDTRGIDPGGGKYPYCWFYPQSPPSLEGDRPAMLASFLTQYCTDQQVIVVGDLFDEWVCPSQFQPTDPAHPMPPAYQQFMNIAAASQNAAVVQALRDLASNGRLTYVPGNHDMLSTAGIMSTIFPGIRYKGNDHGFGVYSEDGIWAEHGHAYGLFNAPSPVVGRGGLGETILPMGFFITRITSDHALNTGTQLSIFDVLTDWIKQIRAGAPDVEDRAAIVDAHHKVHGVVDSIITKLFHDLVKHHTVDQAGAVMAGFEGVPGVVPWADVEKQYADIWSSWNKVHGDDVNPLEAAFCDANVLDHAVSSIAFNHGEARVIILGHSHKREMQYHSSSSDLPGPYDPGPDYIYANCGAWDNGTSECTFVETEVDDDKQLVSLKRWIRRPDGSYVDEDVQPGLWVRFR